MPEPKQPSKQPARTASTKSSKDAKSAKVDEMYREQSKTETEQRPYLDTEGGE